MTGWLRTCRPGGGQGGKPEGSCLDAREAEGSATPNCNRIASRTWRHWGLIC